MKIFGKVNTDLPRHHRFLRIPAKKRAAAMGVWLAATLYTREAELDGFCPEGAISEIASEDILAELVRVGLFAREERDGEHGYEVLRYADHNETKAEIQRRLESDRIRKKGGRNPSGSQTPDGGGNPSGRPPDSERIPSGFHSSPGGGFPVSVSASGSDQIPESQGSCLRADPPPVNATGDGASGMLVSAWAEGVRSAGLPDFLPPWGRSAGNLARVLGKACAGSPDECESARKLGAEYAGAHKGRTLNPLHFADWVGSGKPAPHAPQSRQDAPGSTNANPYDGPAVRAERKRRKADYDEAARNAAPAPIGDLMAAIGGKR